MTPKIAFHETFRLEGIEKREKVSRLLNLTRCLCDKHNSDLSMKYTNFKNFFT